MRKIELLAPAGSLPILKAAIDSGADAVYIGTDLFNARINAVNFTMDDLREGCLYAHRRNSVVYLTLNTLILDSEMDDAISLALDCYNSGIDAILIQDIGLAERLHAKYPDIPLHASTQMNIDSPDDLKGLSELGIRRVVLPRELSVEEIRKRVQTGRRYGIDMEVFAHGAVCVCYSGLCLYSAMNKSGSRSGNRGLCAQPCRQEYMLFDPSSDEGSGDDKGLIKKGHLLSPKDRAVYDYISDLISSGVSSLKIEGRMRDENYVVSAVSAYRKLIDAFYEDGLNDELIRSIEDSLLVSFNRGGSFTSQYLGASKSSDFLSGEYVGKYGLKLGKITSADPKRGTVTFTLGRSSPMPSKNDYLSIRERNREICSFPVGKVHEMPRAASVKGLHPDMISKLTEGLLVYLMSHDFKDEDKKIRKTPVDIAISYKDDTVTLNARVTEGMLSGLFAEVKEERDKTWEGNPLSSERIEAQLRKTGNTPFEVSEVYFDGFSDLPVQISFINDLRRRLTDELISEIDHETEHVISMDYDMFSSSDEEYQGPSDTPGELLTLYYFPSIRSVKGDLDRDADIYAFSIYDLMVRSVRERILSFITNKDSRLCIVMPDGCHDRIRYNSHDLMRDIKEEIGDKLYAVIDPDVMSSSGIYSELSVKHFLSAGANIYNRDSLRYSLTRADGSFLSYETSAEYGIEMVSTGVDDKYILLHSGGPIPWMQSDFCPVGAHKEKCHMCHGNAFFILKDGMTKGSDEGECKVVCHPADCSSTIYGQPKNIYTISDADEILSTGMNVIMCYTEI